MSLSEKIEELAVRVASEFNSVKADPVDKSTGDYLAQDALINLRATAADAKPWITWYDHNNEKIAGIAAHERQGNTGPTGPLHQHISIETADSLGNLQTRFEVTYGADKVEVGIKSADFKIGTGNDLIVGTAAGANSNVVFGNGVFYKYGTGSIGFGDKDWAVDGVYTGAKWEFYRATSAATLLVHNDDGSSDAEVHLRSGTRDYVLTNNGTDFTIEAEGSDVFTLDRDGNLTISGSITAGSSAFLQGSVQADAPSSPSDAYIWHRSTDSRTFIWDSSAWIDLGSGLPSNGTEGQIPVVQANNSIAWADLPAHTHIKADITDFNDADYATAIHVHDDRYYTETEVDTLLSGYSSTSHAHTWSEITGKPALDNYSYWQLGGSGSYTTIGSTAAVNFTGSGATSVSRSGNTITINSPVYDNYGAWGIYVNSANLSWIGSYSTVNFVAGSNVSLSKSGTTVTISASGGASYNQSLNTSDSPSFGSMTLSGILNVNGSSGGVSITAAQDIAAFSDIRLKKDFLKIEGALDKIDLVTGYTFNWKDSKNTRRSTGLIAQELREILPEAVTQDDNGMLSISYGNTVGLLVEAIKELKEEVGRLKTICG